MWYFSPPLYPHFHLSPGYPDDLNHLGTASLALCTPPAAAAADAPIAGDGGRSDQGRCVAASAMHAASLVRFRARPTSAAPPAKDALQPRRDAPKEATTELAAPPVGKKAAAAAVRDVALLRTAAEAGDVKAQYRLSVCFRVGDGVTASLPMAITWLHRSAEAGHAGAQNILGGCYLCGEGVAPNAMLAAAWFRRAAELGDASAQVNMGHCCETGSGVPVDSSQGVNWYRLAAGAGNADAMFCLGSCYERGTGVSADAAQAVAWYRRAARSGHAAASIGRCSEGGVLAGAAEVAAAAASRTCISPPDDDDDDEGDAVPSLIPVPASSSAAPVVATRVLDGLAPESLYAASVSRASAGAAFPGVLSVSRQVRVAARSCCAATVCCAALEVSFMLLLATRTVTCVGLSSCLLRSSSSPSAASRGCSPSLKARPVGTSRSSSRSSRASLSPHSASCCTAIHCSSCYPSRGGTRFAFTSTTVMGAVTSLSFFPRVRRCKRLRTRLKHPR